MPLRYLHRGPWHRAAAVQLFEAGSLPNVQASTQDDLGWSSGKLCSAHLLEWRAQLRHLLIRPSTAHLQLRRVQSK